MATAAKPKSPMLTLVTLLIAIPVGLAIYAFGTSAVHDIATTTPAPLTRQDYTNCLASTSGTGLQVLAACDSFVQVNPGWGPSGCAQIGVSAAACPYKKT